MVRSSQNRAPAVSFLAFAAMLLSASAQFVPYLPQLGHTQLQNALGPGTPDGAGVPVAQIEGSTTGVPVTYLPHAGVGTFPGGANFTGKTFTAETVGSGNVSGHARDVGAYFFGNQTNPAIDYSSMAPGVTTISCFEVTDFITGGVSTTGSRNKKVHSHAWVIYADPGNPIITPANVNGYLRTLDREVDENDFLSVAGVNNGMVSVPEMQASAYNVLSVGLTNGNHSAGLTPGTVDGPGRMKPEIVAPGGTPPNRDKTSFSTGQVASVAAVLYEVAMSSPSLSNASDQSEVMKAILMAGATKEEFPTWSRTQTSPLDATFGAGEANVYQSYLILNGGEQTVGGAVDRRGWDFGSVPSGSPAQEYTVTVPAGFYADASIVATWHRFKDGPSPVAPYVVHDLNLRLENAGETVEWDRSDSPVDNVEHIYYRNLPAGQYIIELTRNGDPTDTTDFGLAWRLNLTKGPFMEATMSGSDVDLSFANLDPGVEYTIERSPGDLVSWTPIHMFTPTTPTNAGMTHLDTTASGSRVHYRLVWAFATN